MKKIILAFFLLVCVGVSAQTRPSVLQLKDDTRYNVRSYGLDNTGATACDAKFVAMLADANINHAYFPKGTYLFTGGIQLPARPGFTLSGDSPVDSKILFGGTIGIKTGTQAGALRTYIRDINVEDRIPSSPDGRAGTTGIFVDCAWVEMDNVAILADTALYYDGGVFSKFYRLNLSGRTVGLRLDTTNTNSCQMNAFTDIAIAGYGTASSTGFIGLLASSTAGEFIYNNTFTNLTTQGQGGTDQTIHTGIDLRKCLYNTFISPWVEHASDYHIKEDAYQNTFINPYTRFDDTAVCLFQPGSMVLNSNAGNNTFAYFNGIGLGGAGDLQSPRPNIYNTGENNVTIGNRVIRAIGSTFNIASGTSTYGAAEPSFIVSNPATATGTTYVSLMNQQIGNASINLHLGVFPSNAAGTAEPELGVSQFRIGVSTGTDEFPSKFIFGLDSDGNILVPSGKAIFYNYNFADPFNNLIGSYTLTP